MDWQRIAEITVAILLAAVIDTAARALWHRAASDTGGQAFGRTVP